MALASKTFIDAYVQPWFSMEDQEMPAETSDGLFMSGAPSILFRMINTQVAFFVV